MRALVVIAHPVETSLTHAAARRAIDGLHAAGHEVAVVDLYADGFAPAMSAGEREAYHGEQPLISADAIAAADPETFPMPRARARALVGLAAAVSGGEVVLDRGADRADVRAALLRLPGIGPWTADYIALRGLGDPDVFMTTDLGVRQGMSRLGLTGDAYRVAQRWRPWRSYALMHVWRAGSEEIAR